VGVFVGFTKSGRIPSQTTNTTCFSGFAALLKTTAAANRRRVIKILRISGVVSRGAGRTVNLKAGRHENVTNLDTDTSWSIRLAGKSELNLFILWHS
jgi:hypothetical protein